MDAKIQIIGITLYGLTTFSCASSSEGKEATKKRNLGKANKPMACSKIEF